MEATILILIACFLGMAQSISINDETVDGELSTVNPTLWCYNCIYNGHPSEQFNNSCVYEPETLTPIPCPSERVCYVKIQTNVAEGSIHTFARGCEIFLDINEGCDGNPVQETCHDFCSTDLCNTGNGRPDPNPTTTVKSGSSWTQGSVYVFVVALHGLVIKP